MKLYIIRDGAFTTNKGRPSSNLLSFDSFGKRYLDVFTKVSIVGRLFNKEDKTAKPVTGEGVSFISLPGKRGALGVMSTLVTVLSTAIKTSKKGNAYLLRIPGNIPTIYFFVLSLKKIPFAVEVAADPFDSYSKKSLDNHLLSPLIQRFFVWMVKIQCRYASASVYVTDYSLQSRYPPGNVSSSFSFTSIDLNEEAYASVPKSADDFNLKNPHLVLTGNMQGSMKGHDILLKALVSVIESGINARLTIIGFGNNTEYYKKMCSELKIEERVHFTGKLESGSPIRKILNTADLFVLPSRQEGLPRALLEAMSLGLPAIGTNVGGIPELLDNDAIVASDSVSQLANKIVTFLSSKETLVNYSTSNLSKARQYSSEKIRLKRNVFLQNLMEVSNK